MKTQERLDCGPNFEILLEALKAEQKTLAAATGRYVPFVIKLSPDLGADKLKIMQRLY